MDLGQKIKEARLKKGLTQDMLGFFVGKHQSSIKKYESNSVDVSYDTLQDICKILDLEIHLEYKDCNSDLKKYILTKSDKLTDEDIELIDNFIDFCIYNKK